MKMQEIKVDRPLSGYEIRVRIRVSRMLRLKVALASVLVDVAASLVGAGSTVEIIKEKDK